jgi:hypothetical protein
MADLFSTAYANNIRNVIAGDPISQSVFRDDVVLQCDTAGVGLPFVINLLSIPNNYWSTQYKLYVVDIGNNASIRTITINAALGEKINGAASITINTNGGGVLIRILDNGEYIAMYNSGAIASPITVKDEGVVITANVQSIDFTGSLVQATAIGNDVTVNIEVPDTGWVDLVGFGYYGVGIQKPQCRKIGKVVYFRGNVVVPLDNPASPGNVVPLTTFASYNTVASPTPFTNSPDGVTTNINGAISFNNDGVVIPTSVVPALTNFDSSYTTGTVIAVRPIAIGGGGSDGTALSAVMSVIIQTDKRLVFQLLKDFEIPGGLAGIAGNSALRFITSNVRSGEYLPNYIAAASDIHNAPSNANFNLVSDTFNLTYPFSCDAGDETQIGGFSVRIDGLTAYLA